MANASRDWVPTIGASLLIPSGPRHDPEKKHLHVIITTATPDGRFLVVPITFVTGRRSDDLSCILQIGDHSFIRHESFAFYEMAGIRDAEDLLEGVKKGRYAAREPATKDLLTKIRQGALLTRRMDDELKDLIQL